DNHIDAARSDEDLDDFESLLAVVGLRDEQVVQIDAQLLGVDGIERVLGVDKRRHAAQLLGFGNDLQRERGLARRLRPENLDDAAARHATDAQGVVDADGAGRNGVDRLDGALLSQAHDRALAKLLFDLADGQIHGPEAFAVLSFVEWGHAVSPWRLGYSRNVPGESQRQNRALDSRTY